MGGDFNGGRQIQLELKIAEAMEELRQLHLRPTLDDFQNFWRKKLETRLLILRQEVRRFEVEGRDLEADSTTAAA